MHVGQCRLHVAGVRLRLCQRGSRGVASSRPCGVCCAIRTVPRCVGVHHAQSCQRQIAIAGRLLCGDGIIVPDCLALVISGSSHMCLLLSTECIAALAERSEEGLPDLACQTELNQHHAYSYIHPVVRCVALGRFLSGHVLRVYVPSLLFRHWRRTLTAV